MAVPKLVNVYLIGTAANATAQLPAFGRAKKRLWNGHNLAMAAID
jgi:hypothetical protein